MDKNLKSYIFAFIFWAVNLKLFFLVSNFTQVTEIFKTSHDIFSFYKSIWTYFSDFLYTVPLFTMFLTTIFSVLLFIFWMTYFKVFFHRLPSVKSNDSGYLGVVSSLVAFLGFGCVACGQTLLSSVLLFFVSSGSTLLAHTLGNIAIIIGAVLLWFGIKKNQKVFRNRNICAID